MLTVALADVSRKAPRLRARPETTQRALARLQSDAEQVAQVMAAGRRGLPALAMGSDDEALIHIGIDRVGTVVRFDLEPDWRAVLGPAALGGAVTQAVRQAGDVRCGDWATAVAAANDPTPRAPVAQLPQTAPGAVERETVRLDPRWLDQAGDEAIREAALRQLAAADAAEGSDGGSRSGPVRVVQDRAQSTWQLLAAQASTLPRFMQDPVQANIDRIYDDIVQALTLPVSSLAAATSPLADCAAILSRCQRQGRRQATFPEATQLWTEAGVSLLSGLRGSPTRSPWWRRRRLDAPAFG